MKGNHSFNIYIESPFINFEDYSNNIKNLKKLGHKITNKRYSYKNQNELVIQSINNSDLIIIDATKFVNFCLEEWMYYKVAVELNKEVWIISNQSLNQSLNQSKCFKDWFEVYSELHPV